MVVLELEVVQSGTVAVALVAVVGALVAVEG